MSLWNHLKQTRTNSQYSNSHLPKTKEEAQLLKNLDNKIILHHLEAIMHIKQSINLNINHRIREDTKRNSGLIIQTQTLVSNLRIKTFKTFLEMTKDLITVSNKQDIQIQTKMSIKKMFKGIEEVLYRMNMII